MIEEPLPLDPEQSSPEQPFLGVLRLSRRLDSVRQVVATGLVIIAGLVFLLPGVIQQTARLDTVTPVVLGALLIGLTLLNVIELLAGSSEAGGSYVLVHEAWSGTAGFATGWSLFALGITLAAALFKTLGAALVLAFPALAPYAMFVPLAVFGLVIIIQLFGMLPTRNRTWALLALLGLGLAILGFLRIIQPGAAPANVSPTGGDLLRAIAWITLAIASFEVLLSGRRQIQDPRRQLPQGLLVSLFIGAMFLAAAQGLVQLVPELPASMGVIHGLAQGDMVRFVGAVVMGCIALLIAGNNSLMVAARQIYIMSRFGALPRRFTSLRRPFRLPPLIFIVLLLTTPLFWLPTPLLLDIGAAAALIVVFTLNLSALISRQREPDRRRWFKTPLFPLVPALAVTASPFIFFSLPSAGLIGVAAWLAVGALYFTVYARSHIMEAQHGVLVFGREPLIAKDENGYRILVPLTAGVERQFVLTLAASLAKQAHGEVIPLQVIPMNDPLAIQEGRRIAQERNTLFDWSTRDAGPNEVPIHPITRLASSVAKGIHDTALEEECDLILLTWPVTTVREGTRMGRILDPVVRNAPCDVAVVAYHPEFFDHNNATNGDHLTIRNILVPTAGGPNAPLATRLALQLASEFDASTRTVYVTQPEASEAELAEGRRRIENTLQTMRETLQELHKLDLSDGDVPLESVVVQAASIIEGIIQAGADSDLVLIGASEESLLNQVILGTLPEQVARACPTPVVMVKRYRGLPRFWLQRLWDSLSQALPTLSLEEQVEVYKRVRRDARPDTDFFVMMGLATTIATYGLLQGSAAVIIGAMLVAPLFTPILAGSLAVVQGDIRMLRVAFEAALKGIALAIGLAVVLTALSPLRTLTAEIASRTSPNLFDLVVALTSGAAGAYAVARKDVATALPGVAIAAALVPPLCVVGVGIAMGDPRVTGGATLLFVTNLIAITLAGSTTLLLLGFRPAADAEREARLRLGILTSLVLLTAITIPLAVVFVDAVQTYQADQVIEQVITDQLKPYADIDLVAFEQSEVGDQLIIRTEINTAGPLVESLAGDLSLALRTALGRPITLQLVAIPVQHIELIQP